MRIAYFDTFAGIAGDMVLGAFVSSGVDVNRLRSEIARLNIGNVELRAEKVVRNGITATKVDVVVSGRVEKVDDLGPSLHENSHKHSKHHGDHEHGKSYLEIKHLIENSGLSDFVKSKSLAVFSKLAEAEAKIHDTTVDKIHFHEVGAADSIVDIVGAAICIEITGVESIYTSPIRLGSGGYIDARHGVLPVPAPAAIEILKDYPVIFNDIPFELTTPTGAAIVSALSNGVLKDRPIEIEKIGYGSGTRELGSLPNLLRLIIGQLKSELEEDHGVLVETNVDDINPQVIPFVIEKVLSLGATDAFVTPVIMKKGRPGFMLSVLIPETLLDRIAAEIFSQTTTLGLRIRNIRRMKVHREVKTVKTSFGDVQVKESNINGKKRISAEFEECKRISESKNIPLAEVMQRLNAELNRE
ncbi:MAG TPA: nickel pincer cofactor biosynthesis protein LarC [Candidatus Acidoferrales bacterium]|nr:nickel pincer cofactor biosynthesis protein LarC [Candidatus Acidoferrales bacterium]